jgi:hypothetical protein
MILSRMFARGLILPVALAAPLVQSPALGAPKTYNYKGTVANACTLSNSSVGVTVNRAPSVGITVAFSPTTVTGSCNGANGGTLSVSSTRLQQVGSPANFVNYTVRVSGWSATPFDYATAASPPPPSTGSKANRGTATVSFACQAGCGTTNINQNTTYTATITLGLSPNP